MSETDSYTFVIRWSEEDEEWLATCPAFPGLSAFGGTRASALREGEVALALFIESYKESGEMLPTAELVTDWLL